MTAPLHPQYPEDGGRDAQAAWAAHLEGCATCRARVLADDPTRLFALLGRRPVPVAVLDEVAATVAAAVAGERPEAAGGRVAARAAAAAAAAILAVAGAIVSLDPDRRVVATAARPPRAPRAYVTLLDAEAGSRMVDLTLGDTQVVMIYDARVRP